MANVIVEEQSLQNIANSIRSKARTNNTFKPSEMSNAIMNIPTGFEIVDARYLFYNGARANSYNMINKYIDNLVNVTNTSYMFSIFFPQGGSPINDYSNGYFNVPNFDTSKVYSMTEMFSGAGLKLTNIPNYNTSNVIYMNYLFSNRTSLIDINSIDNWDISKVKYIDGFFSGMNTTPIGSLTFRFPNWNTSNIRGFSNLFSRVKAVNNSSRIDLDGVLDITSAFDINCMFENCNMFKNICNITTSNENARLSISVVNIFAGCEADRISDINLSGINTHFETIFKKCNCPIVQNINLCHANSIGSIYGGGPFTGLHTNIRDVSNIDLSNASDAYAFFTSNKLVNVRDINVYNCSNLVNMFCDSRALINVDNIICVNDANCLNMFYNCSKLVSISNLKLSSITNAYQMFSRCNNLVNLPMLNLHNVNNMTSTFYACNNLSSNSYANIANSLPLANNLTNKYLSSMSLNVNNFTVEQILILNNKGYIDANLSAYSNEYEITYSNL